ncbi:unnamed protein product, partial [Lymnaea stagnalis]
MAMAVYNWFHSEVYFWRRLASICWSVIFMPVVLMAFIFLSTFSAIHPFQWFSDSSVFFLNSRFWLAVLINSICLVVLTMFTLPHFSVAAEVNKTVLSSNLALFRWSRLPLLVASIETGAVAGWSLAWLIGDEYGTLTTVLNTETYESKVLNEPHVFLVLAATFAGFCCYWMFFQQQQYYLSFPHVQRSKSFRVRYESMVLLHATCWQSIHVVKYFYIFYFMFGNLFKRWISGSFGITTNPEVPPINSLLGIFNLSLLWQTYLCTFLLVFTTSLARTMTRVFYTEPTEFAMAAVLEQDKDITLSEALACMSSPLLQHLAFLDLSCLSKFSHTRRQELLSLSQPGGHPRIWLSVSGVAFGVIRELNDLVKKENGTIMSKVSVNAHKSSSQSSGFSHTLSGDTASSLSHRVTGTESSEMLNSSEEEHKSSSFLAKSLSAVSSLPLISQILAEYPDTSSRSLFASCQLQIWAIEAVSLVASKSLRED